MGCVIQGCSRPVESDSLAESTSINAPVREPVLWTGVTSRSAVLRSAGVRFTSIVIAETEAVSRSNAQGPPEGSRGYIFLLLPDHPLANGRWVYEHRVALYEKLGPGPQECWWCGRAISWEENLDVDHLDYDRSNNDPSNLVPSCRACNRAAAPGAIPKDGRSRWRHGEFSVVTPTSSCMRLTSSGLG